MPVIDASVAIKWFVEEPGSPAAHRLLEAHAAGDETLIAPDLIVYEVSNVLLHHPTFSIAEVQRSVGRLYELELELIAPSAAMVTSALALASARRLSFYDALYVQLAIHLDIPLYTAPQTVSSSPNSLTFRLSDASDT